MTEEQEKERRLRDVTAELNGFKEEQLTLKGFEPIKAFVLREIDFWGGFENPHNFAAAHHSHYRTIRNHLNQIEEQNQNWDDRQFNQNWGNMAAVIGQKLISNSPVIVSSSPVAEFLRVQWTENPELSIAAHSLLTKNTGSVQLNSVNTVIGFLRAHEFENADLPSTTRSKVEEELLEECDPSGNKPRKTYKKSLRQEKLNWKIGRKHISRHMRTGGRRRPAN